MTDEESSGIGPVRLDPVTQTLWIGDRDARLRAKTLDVLTALIRSSGALVERQTLLDQIWGPVPDNRNGPKQCIRELRRLLGDTANAPRFIETVGRQGYRLIADIGLEDDCAEPKPSGVISAPFVGREGELAILAAAMDGCLQGRRALCLISGEAGAGKSTLVDHFASGMEKRRDICVARAQCIQHSGVRAPYAPLLEMLQSLIEGAFGAEIAALVEHEAPSWRSHIYGSAPDGAHGKTIQGGASEPDRMLRELLRLMERICRRIPVLVVIEDLQWADAATIEWLIAWSRRRTPERSMLLGTFRPDGMETDKSALADALHELRSIPFLRLLDLPGLDGGSVRSLIAHRFPNNSFPPTIAADLAEHTGGHAFFVAALIEDWVADGLIRREEGGWICAADTGTMLRNVAGNAGAFVAARIARLGIRERRLLEHASVAGSSFVVGVLAETHDSIEELEELCEDLARSGIFLRRRDEEIWPDGTVFARYAFRHALYQQAFYARLTPTSLRRRHLRIALKLEAVHGGNASSVAALLASHFERGGDHPRAAGHYRNAGVAAMRNGDVRGAIMNLERALGLLRSPGGSGVVDPGEELSVLMHLGAALIAREGFASSELARVYDRARSLSGDLPDRSMLFRSLYGLWNYRLTRRELKKAAALASRLREIGEGVADGGRALIVCNMTAIDSWLGGRLEHAAGTCDDVIASYDADLHGRSSITFGEDIGVVGHHCGAIVRQLMGHAEEADRHFLDGMSLAESLDQPFAMTQMLWAGAVIARERRDVGETRRRAARLVEIAREAECSFWCPGGELLLGWTYAVGGEREPGLGLIRQAINRWDRMGVELTKPYSVAVLADACGSADAAAARAAVTEGLDLVDSSGERWYEAELLRLLGKLCSGRDAPRAGNAEAIRHFTHALDVARNQGARHLAFRVSASLTEARGA